MNLRNKVYWLKDSLLGHGIMKRSYNDVKRSFEEGIENEEQLSSILKWATEEVPFYKQYAGKRFEEFPVVNKNVIKEGGDNFMATCMKGLKLHEERTSGSTGSPFTIFQDSQKRREAES